MKHLKTFALIISVVFHPLLMATYACMILFYIVPDTVYDYLTPRDTKWRISLIVFMFSFVFPVLNIYILYKLKRLPSMILSNQMDRTFPYIMTSLFYFGLFYLMKDINIWPSLKLFVVGGGLAILLTALINFKTKISAHMVGLGGLLGVMISVSYLIRFDMIYVYMAIIILAGLVGFARLLLEEHKPLQIYLGFFLGLILQTTLFFSFQRFIFA